MSGANPRELNSRTDAATSAKAARIELERLLSDAPQLAAGLPSAFADAAERYIELLRKGYLLTPRDPGLEYTAQDGPLVDGAVPFRDVFSSQGPLFLPLVWLADLLGGRTLDAPRLLEGRNSLARDVLAGDVPHGGPEASDVLACEAVEDPVAIAPRRHEPGLGQAMARHEAGDPGPDDRDPHGVSPSSKLTFDSTR